jgi:flavodoxin I
MIIPFIYASTSGNVEATMENISQKVSGVGAKTELFRVEKCDFSIIENNEIFVFATSTWDHGTLNPFWDKFVLEFSKHDLKGKKAFFVGLGDFRYEAVYFCRGIDTLKDSFLGAGGLQIGATLKVNGDPFAQFDKLIAIWTDNLVKELKNLGKI